MYPEFDPETLRLPPGSVPAPCAPRRRPPQHRKGERFLRGPIPLEWLSAACQLGGRALHVGVALWFAAGLTRSREVALSLSQSASFGFDRFSGARGLAALERAGLVRLQRRTGRKPLVTLAEAPRGEGATSAEAPRE